MLYAATRLGRRPLESTNAALTGRRCLSKVAPIKSELRFGYRRYTYWSAVLAECTIEEYIARQTVAHTPHGVADFVLTLMPR